MVQVAPFSFTSFTCSGLGISTLLGRLTSLALFLLILMASLLYVAFLMFLLFCFICALRLKLCWILSKDFSVFIEIIIYEFVQDSSCRLCCVYWFTMLNYSWMPERKLAWPWCMIFFKVLSNLVGKNFPEGFCVWDCFSYFSIFVIRHYDQGNL